MQRGTLNVINDGAIKNGKTKVSIFQKSLSKMIGY